MANQFSSDVTRLPPEVWHIIAENLLKTRSADFENLVNSSGFFQEVLASLRTTYLFEKVFPLVASSVWKKEGLDGMPVSDVLKLRGVCKHWSAVIEKLIPEKLQYFGKGSNDENIRRIGAEFKSVVDLDFTHLIERTSEVNECIHEFLRHFERSHPGHPSNGRNPFIWRNIYVDTHHDQGPQEEEYQKFLKGVTAMLSKYGSHVHDFILYFDEEEFSDLENAPVYQKWFSLMPNLKELNFMSSCDNDWEDQHGNLTPEWKFPKYKNLERLEMEALPVTLVHSLIRQNNQVSTLIVEYVLDDYDFFTFPLPNLKILEIGHLSEKHVNQLATLQDNWPLENLSIMLFKDYAVSNALVQVIQEKFSSTLVTLEISFLACGQEDEDPGRHWLAFKNSRLQLPKLTKTDFLIQQNKVCLDFLLGMKQNLEEISITVDYKRPLMREGTLTSGIIVQVLGFEGKMLESNVWVLFKKLRKIKIKAEWEGQGWKTRLVTREEWMLKNEYI